MCFQPFTWNFHYIGAVPKDSSHPSEFVVLVLFIFIGPIKLEVILIVILRCVCVLPESVWALSWTMASGLDFGLAVYFELDMSKGGAFADCADGAAIDSMGRGAALRGPPSGPGDDLARTWR